MARRATSPAYIEELTVKTLQDMRHPINSELRLDSIDQFEETNGKAKVDVNIIEMVKKQPQKKVGTVLEKVKLR